MKMNIFFKVQGIFLISIFLLVLSFSCNTGGRDAGKKNIVILTGRKSHPATMHEYIKNARLIKVMLDNSVLSGQLNTRIVYNGWPEEESILDSADLILTISDGSDGPNGQGVPFMTDERMDIMEKQVSRGCGIMTFHYSTFAPDKYADQLLEWTGGYFDWQNDQGERAWYSNIKFMDVPVKINSESGHPVLNGVKPFKIYEEYYFDMRFRDDDPRLIPIIEVSELENKHPLGDVVAWAVERDDGGRGFGTTLGHLYANWRKDDYRKLLVNAIAWTAGAQVPENGIETECYSDREVTRLLFGKEYKGLILTGEDHPAHDWKKTVPVLKQDLEENGLVHMDISTNINDLNQYDLRDYDFLVFSYANWETPDPLWDGSKKALKDYVEQGGSLMFVHFANGAFHYSLPDAGASDWPYYRTLCRRVWDHTSDSSHDKYGRFTVDITDHENELTRGLQSFETSDELYYNQKGDEPIHVIMTAHSKVTDRDEPMAWTYDLQGPTGKNARVFQTVLGHDSVSLSAPELKAVLSRAGIWLAAGTQRWSEL